MFTRREDVNKGKHETFQAEVRRPREECKRRETRDLRSGRGASRSSDIIEGKKRVSCKKNLKRTRKAGNAGYAVAIMK